MRHFSQPLLLLLALLPALQGCLFHTHKVQKTVSPSVTKDATAEQLVEIVNRTNASVESLKATVTFQVSVGGERKGKVTDFTSLSGYIRLRAPQALRVVGLLPVVHTQAFDLASDGKRFDLVVPHNNKAYTGANTMEQPSTNPIENLRPAIFFDTMILKPIGPDDLVERTELTRTRTDPKTKQLLARPEYLLSVVHRRGTGQVLVPDRRVHFDRETLLPSGIDIYDENGNPATRATYGPYASFGDRQYPSTITIRRPLDEYQIVIAIQKLTIGEQIADNQFKLTIPPGYTVVQLH